MFFFISCCVSSNSFAERTFLKKAAVIDVTSSDIVPNLCSFCSQLQIWGIPNNLQPYKVWTIKSLMSKVKTIPQDIDFLFDIRCLVIGFH